VTTGRGRSMVPWFARPLAEGRTYAQAIGLVLDPLVGLVWSLVVAVLLLAGAGLAVTVIGLPLLGEVVMIARSAGALERARARALLGVRVGAPPPADLPSGWWPRTRAMLGGRAGWRAAGYPFILCLSGILSLAAAAVWIMGIAALFYPAWRWLWPLQAGSQGYLTGPGVMAAIAAGGLVVSVAGAWLVRAAARMDAALVAGMLGPSPGDLSRRVAALEASRAKAVEQAAAERRRIERDLHDGVQARLVSLAMELGRARQQLEAGETPPAAAGLVAQAHEEALRAVAELRDLARGIHPAVLTDRGLDAALSALVVRAPIPVEVNVCLPRRPPAAVEAIAYFVIAEALANITKHATASRASVAVRHDGSTVIVEVIDDGAGGAHLAPGGGLAGLASRLQAVDGRLAVTSPAGGPTVVRAELPCGS
jgi:signal transduction histidine kinase